MSEVYSYEIGVETGASVVNLDLLQQQIFDSSMSAGAKADFEGLSSDGTNVFAAFANPLSTGAGSDKEKLDGVMAAHMGEETTEVTQREISFGAAAPNSSTNWVNVLQLQAPMMKAGTYNLLAKCELRLTNGADFNGTSPVNAPNRACEARVRIDGADRVRWINPFDSWDAKFAGDEIELVEGAVPLIEIDFRVLGALGGDSAECRRRIINLSFAGRQGEEEGGEGG